MDRLVEARTGIAADQAANDDVLPVVGDTDSNMGTARDRIFATGESAADDGELDSILDAIDADELANWWA